MAKAAGQTFPDFTPPDGETQDQVTSHYIGSLTKKIQPIH